MKNLLIILSLFSFAGCASFKRSVEPQEFSKIKKIAVLSSLGSEMHHTYIGDTIFGNKDSLVKVNSWKIDEWAEQNMKATLSSNEAFQKVDAIHRKVANTDMKSEAGRLAILKMAKTQGYDIVINLAPSSYDNAPLFKPGYGLYRYSEQKDVEKFAYMMAVITVYDVAKEEQMAWQWTFDPWNLNPGIVDTALLQWKDNFKSYSPDEKKQILDALKNRIQEGIKYSLKALKLI